MNYTKEIDIRDSIIIVLYSPMSVRKFHMNVCLFVITKITYTV